MMFTKAKVIKLSNLTTYSFMINFMDIILLHMPKSSTTPLPIRFYKSNYASTLHLSHGYMSSPSLFPSSPAQYHVCEEYKLFKSVLLIYPSQLQIFFLSTLLKHSHPVSSFQDKRPSFTHIHNSR
jgi:hypothetical protein